MQIKSYGIKIGDKYIASNYGVEMAPVQFQMSKKDGKSVLIKSVNAKGVFTLKSPDHTIAESCELAAISQCL